MVKQVIVIRKDLRMRRGKEIAQSCHSSIAFLSHIVRDAIERSSIPLLTSEQVDWIIGRFTKICVCVNSEQELLEIQKKAQEVGLTVHLITDAGLTEFNGVPTNTCLAVGPHDAEKIDPITGHLSLY